MALPETANAMEIQIEEQPTRTYGIDYANKRIAGKKEGLAAMVQAVRKALETQRYTERIYSGDYGSELHKLIGKQKDYARAKLRMLIEDALSTDRRVRGIKSINTRLTAQDEIVAEVQVITDYGEIKIEESIGG
ncbi:MAG: DUF2634 domain-containing protein [Fibrobacter sp.]|nr:DUF2634 domain-containing protein [Fibrobacter sp.]